MRRRMMALTESLNGATICTARHCFADAKWWLTVRENGLDVDHARCEEHSR
jgi:hypothetical protein